MSNNKLQCRLCGSDQALLSMFSGINRQSRDYLRKMIMDVVHIKLDPDDACSKCVCLKCAVHVCNFFKFMQICRETNEKFKDLPSGSDNSTKCSGTKVCDIKSDSLEELIFIVEQFLDKKTHESRNLLNNSKNKLLLSASKPKTLDCKYTQTLPFIETNGPCKCTEKLINTSDSQTQTYVDFKNRFTQTTPNIKNEGTQVEIIEEQQENKIKLKSKFCQTQLCSVKDIEIQTDLTTQNKTNSPVTSLVTINCENLFKPHRNSFDSLSSCSSDRLSSIVTDNLLQSINNDIQSSSQLEDAKESQVIANNNKNSISIADKPKNDIVLNNIKPHNENNKNNQLTDTNLKLNCDPEQKNENYKIATENKIQNKLRKSSKTTNEVQFKKELSRTTKIVKSVIQNDKKNCEQDTLITLNKNPPKLINSNANDNNSKPINKSPIHPPESTDSNVNNSNSEAVIKPNAESIKSRNKTLLRKPLIRVKTKNTARKQTTMKPNDPRNNVKKVLDFDEMFNSNINCNNEPLVKDSTESLKDDKAKLNNSLSNDFKTNDEHSPLEKTCKSNTKLISNDKPENLAETNSIEDVATKNNLVMPSLNNNLETLPDKEANENIAEIALTNNTESVLNKCKSEEVPKDSPINLDANSKKRTRGTKRKINVHSLTKSAQSHKKIKLSDMTGLNDNNTSSSSDKPSSEKIENGNLEITTPEKSDLTSESQQTNNTPSNHLLSPSLRDLLTVKKCQYQHVCRTCYTTFNSLLEMRRHQRSHMHCPICKMKFRSILQTVKHQQTCKVSSVRASVKLIRLEKDLQILDSYPDVKEYLGISNQTC